MQNAQVIYRQTIRLLPADEKLRLAALILQDLSDDEENQTGTTSSALDLLEGLAVSGERVFGSTREIDEHLKAERESWGD